VVVSRRFSAEDDEGGSHRAVRVAITCGHERRHGLPPQRRQIQPPNSLTSSP
jgi:hypothetical protein